MTRVASVQVSPLISGIIAFLLAEAAQVAFGGVQMIDRAGSDMTNAGNVRLVVEVGNEYFEPGRTRLELDRDGQCIVTTRFEGEEARSEGRIDAQRAEAIIERATRAPFWDQPLGDAPGIPDEPRYELTLSGKDIRFKSVHVWRSELHEQPQGRQIISALQGITTEITDGQAIL